MTSLGVHGTYDIPKDALVMFTIYEHPRDFPHDYVVRRSFIADGKAYIESKTWAVERTLDDARRSIPAGLWPLPRSPIDDPVIVESWV